MPGRLIYLMGPSGSGKDSLIEAAAHVLQRLGCLVAQRTITRSAQAIGEAAVGVSASEFRTLEAQGAFALSWHANGLGYGIPILIDPWLAAGHHVVVNGSRGHLKQALQRYPTLIPILLTVEHEVLRQRLVARGRETVEQIDQRLARNQQFAVGSDLDAGVTLYRLDNSASLSATVARLQHLLEQALSVPAQDRVELVASADQVRDQQA